MADRPRKHALALSCVAVLLVLLPARTQAQGNDPYEYGLRFGLFPLAFRAGISQSAFTGTASSQVQAFVRRVETVASKYPEAAAYVSEPIL
jgi:hypothetical protein